MKLCALTLYQNARGNCKTPRPSKIALLSHFVAPPPSPTLLSMCSAVEFGPHGGSDKLAQNHRFFWSGEFCNFLAQISLYLCVLALALLVGCGYHYEEVEAQSGAVMISVPYIKGDPEGQLNTELVRALSSTGQFDCVQSGGALILEASIIGESDDRIGFRYDRVPTTGKRRTNIVGTENRHTMTAVVSLVSAYTQEVIIGPETIIAYTDYDYVDSNSIRDLTFTDRGTPERVLDFSLGQLDSVSGAHDDSSTLIYKILAQKIVDGLVVMKACELAAEEKESKL